MRWPAWFGVRKPRKRPRRSPRPCSVERLEDRCLLDSCFSQLFTTQHLDLGFDYVAGRWDAAVEDGDAFPTSQRPPDQALLWVDPAAQLNQPAGPQWAFLGAGAGNPVWILPQSQDPRLLYLGAAAEDTPTGTFASYFEPDPRVGGTFPWIRLSLRAVRGPGNFALYQTDFAGTPIVWMSTADGIGATDATFIPQQGHVHFNWAFSQRGFYEVDVQASAFLNDGSMTPVSSPVVTFYFSVDPVLQVTSLTPTATGFIARLNRPFDAGALNLYDDSTAGLGPADVTLTNAAGQEVRGTLVPEGINCVRFVATGGALPADTYTVRLRSAANGFKTTALGTQSTLDGNNDGTPGDDLVGTFTVAPPAGVTVGVPDFTRGPGQAVHVPATASGLPVRLSDGGGITAVDLTLRFNPALLTVRAAVPGPDLPGGATVTLDTSTPGVAVLSFRSPTALGPGAQTLALLTADVPAGATYAAKHVLDLADLRVNGGAVPALDDDGVHVAGYFGDTSGNGAYASTDATRALRVAVGLDSGFGAYQLADPVLIADITGNGVLNAADATRILQESIGLDQDLIPPLPVEPPFIPPSGPDPLLSFPTTLAGRPGEFVEVPLYLDVSDGLETADLAISYDTSRLEVVADADVRPGSLTEDFDLFLANVDRAAGTMRVGLGRVAGPVAGRGAGSVLVIRFRIRDDAPAGPAVVNLRQGLSGTYTGLNDGGLVLTPAPDDAAGDALDGLITVEPAPDGGLVEKYFRLVGECAAGRAAFPVNSPDDLAPFVALLPRRRKPPDAATT